MALQQLNRGLVAVGLVAAVATGCGAPRSPSVSPSPPAPSPLPSTQTVKVPDLAEKSRAGAIRAVLELGLNVRVVSLGEPAGKPKDSVARQVPLPGSRVPIGAEVLLVVYCRPAPCQSPPKGRTIYDPCTCATRS